MSTTLVLPPMSTSSSRQVAKKGPILVNVICKRPQSLLYSLRTGYHSTYFNSKRKFPLKDKIKQSRISEEMNGTLKIDCYVVRWPQPASPRSFLRLNIPFMEFHFLEFYEVRRPYLKKFLDQYSFQDIETVLGIKCLKCFPISRVQFPGKPDLFNSFKIHSQSILTKYTPFGVSDFFFIFLGKTFLK